MAAATEAGGEGEERDAQSWIDGRRREMTNWVWEYTSIDSVCAGSCVKQVWRISSEFVFQQNTSSYRIDLFMNLYSKYNLDCKFAIFA